jgi:hypothetical protein
MGIDPMQSIREKINPYEKSDDRTYQLYELDEKEKDNLPFWFKEGNYIHFYKKGKTIIKSNVRTRTGFKTMILEPSKWKKAAQSYHHTLLNLRSNQCFKQTIHFHMIGDLQLNYKGFPWPTLYPP